MRIAIATGGRKYANKDAVEAALIDLDPQLLICGGATGADTLARQAAIKMGIQVIEIPANWRKWDMAAGPKRNALMADVAESLAQRWPSEIVLMAFPGGSGTNNMRQIAYARGFRIFLYDENVREL